MAVDGILLEKLKEQIREELQSRNRIEEEELNACIHQVIEEEAVNS